MMTRKEITYRYVIADVTDRLKEIAKAYAETGDAEAMHSGINQILYGPGYKRDTKEEGAET